MGCAPSRRIHAAPASEDELPTEQSACVVLRVITRRDGRPPAMVVRQGEEKFMGNLSRERNVSRVLFQERFGEKGVRTHPPAVYRVRCDPCFLKKGRVYEGIGGDLLRTAHMGVCVLKDGCSLTVERIRSEWALLER